MTRTTFAVMLFACGADFTVLSCHCCEHPNGSDAGPDVTATPTGFDGGAVDGAADADAPSSAPDVACTPMTNDPTSPATCACYFNGTCPIVNGQRSRECIWSETPLNITGQPTCRGCGQLLLPVNPCHLCSETFNCACYAAYFTPGQRCCDGLNGPYMSDYPCP